MNFMDIFTNLLSGKKPQELGDVLSSGGTGVGGDTIAGGDAVDAPKQSMGDMLNGMSTGKPMDFNAFLEASAPKKYEGKSLWNQIMENPIQGLAKIGANIPNSNDDGVGWGAMIGRGAEAANKKDEADYNTEQKRLGEVLTAATKGAGDQRAFGLDSKKQTDDASYKQKSLAETIRDNMEKNKIQQGMLGVSQGQLGVAQANAANSKLSTPIVADDGNTYSFDSKAGKWVTVPSPNGVTFNNTKKDKKTNVEAKDLGHITDALSEALGGTKETPVDESILGKMALEASQWAQNNNGDVVGGINHAISGRGGMDNFDPSSGNWNPFNSNRVRMKDKPLPDLNIPGVPPSSAMELLKKDPSLAAQFDKKYGAGSSKKALGK